MTLLQFPLDDVEPKKMSGRPRTSVAMAVYNGERFIQEQLDSYVRQTRLPDEPVVSDNASTDRTVEIVRAFAQQAPFRVRLFINESNLGVTKNFERAIRECTGDIIFLSDCDDVWYTDKVATMAAMLESSPEKAIVLSDADLVGEDLRPLGERLWQQFRFRATRRTMQSVSQPRAKGFRIAYIAFGNCMAFRSNLISLVLPFPDGERFLNGQHDIFIALTSIYSAVGGVGLVAKPLLAYRRHRQQMSAVLGSDRSSSSLMRAVSRIDMARERPANILVPFLERVQSAAGSRLCRDQKVRNRVLTHWERVAIYPLEKSPVFRS